MSKELLKILFVFLVVIASVSCANAVTNLTACTGAGAIASGDYILKNNVTSSGSNCFVFGSSNTHLDCQGYSLTGDGSFRGIDISSGATANTSVKNCVIINYTNGIFQAGDYGSFDNLTVSTIQEGILLDLDSDRNNVTNSYIYSSTNQGIFAQRSDFNIIKNNRVHTVFNSGIQLYAGADNNTVFNNTAYNCSFGIQIYDSDYNNISQNIFYNNTYGVMVTANSIGNMFGDTRGYNNSNTDYNCTTTQTDKGNNCGSTQNGCGLALETCYFSAPQISIIRPTAGTKNTTTQLLNISAVDSQETKYNWNGTNQTYTVPLNINFPDLSTITLYAFAENNFGSNSTSVTFSIFVPTTPSEIAEKGVDALGFFMDWGLIILLIVIVLFTIFALSTGVLNLNMLITGIFIIIVLYITIAISSMIIISVGGT